MTSTITIVSPDQAQSVADQIKATHRQSNAVRAELLLQIARFDELQLFESFGETSSAAWLSRELRYRKSTAYEYVGVAHGLQRFPLLTQVFAAGEIEYTTVRFLLRYMTEDNELELVQLATSMCFAELEQTLAGTDRDRGKPDAPFFDARQRSDGSLEGKFLLPPVIGQALLAALKIAQLASDGAEAKGEDIDAMVQEMVEVLEAEMQEEQLDDATVTDPHPDLSRKVDLGEGADVEEACPGEQTKRSSEISLESILRLPSRYGPPVKADMYSAFVTMINMVRDCRHPAVRAPGAHVTVMLTEDGKAWMPSNPQAPAAAIKHYVGNAYVRGHLLNSQGLTMHYGRERRFASDAQVQALLSLWGNQCAMPGCTHSRFMEIHHIRDWADGGKTDIGNLIPLCSSCHSRVSHGIASITPRANQLEFRFLDGSRFISENRSLPRVATPDRTETRKGNSFDE